MEYITDITQDVTNKLELVGYEVADTDYFLLSESIEKIRYYIKNKTNLNKIPLGLKYVWINKTVGEFLSFKLKLGQLKIESLNFGRIAKEISEGDTKLVYDNTTTTGDKFEVFLNDLMTKGEDEFIKYRRFVW